ncbi:cell wall hydrolase [Rhizorhapis sp. SPR117]|uniref:cell wall hydrolase n=1 Tax=Rhizorhapis sp. SPR117 TaxID=2912611 RepID=UPI001F30976C|nr:cell wall hydrolase [Rhizorhapis sp. SPR117]
MTHFAAADVMTPTRRHWLKAFFVLALFLLPAFITSHPPQGHLVGTDQSQLAKRSNILRLPTVPAVDPTQALPVDRDKARLLNADVPFSARPNPAARPFRLKGSAADLARATDCLAAAQWYEAGDDAPGQQAVAQVVINRLRHPAFPKSVCGVIFEGAQRASGCQFTFTCDGALTRTPSQAAWQRARTIARAALSGSVFAEVGNATHYHTDWVVPYWSSSLDKVAAIGTHLFFRWKGWWGTPAAFRSARIGTEPSIPTIARLSSAHAQDLPTGSEEQPTLADSAGGQVPIAKILPVSVGQRFGSAEVVAADSDGASFIVALDKNASPEGFQTQALALCGGRPRCRVMGWTDAARTPGGFPVYPGLLDAMAYSYMRDGGTRFERSLWNCEEFPRTVASQCMASRNPVKVAAVSRAG